MITIYLLLLALVVPDYQAELERYVADFLYPVRLMRDYEQRQADALATIPIVLDHCRRHKVDPLQVATIMTYESSWRKKAVGDRGELGLMQTMPKHFKQFDLTTRDGQIAAGVSFWKQSLDACGGDIEQAFNYYGTGGRCKPVYKFAKRRHRHYKRAVRKYREGR
jgi:hypothetical protein